jgi:hypothetical protein
MDRDGTVDRLNRSRSRNVGIVFSVTLLVGPRPEPRLVAEDQAATKALGEILAARLVAENH